MPLRMQYRSRPSGEPARWSMSAVSISPSSPWSWNPMSHCGRGGGRLAWPQVAAEDQIPPWLVFGGMIRTVSMTGVEPGLNQFVTALEEEGFSDVMSVHLVESFARNFMHIMDAWLENGFGE